MDVAKVDPDVAYVAMALHICCKRLFQMFHLFLQTFVASVLSRYFICFHTYVANVLSGCCICLEWFSNVFSYFCKCFRHKVTQPCAYRPI